MELTPRQEVRIRADLKEMQAKQGWAQITDEEIGTPRLLHLHFFPEEYLGRGCDVSWIWSNAEIIVQGITDVYGDGSEALYCRPEDWWVTADDGDPE